jgi:putative sugar O-methyltransferase
VGNLLSIRRHAGFLLERKLQSYGLTWKGRSSAAQLSLLEEQQPSELQIVNLDEYQSLWHAYVNHPLSKVSLTDVWYQGTEFKDTLKDINLMRFRADNAYLWQLKSHDISRFVISALFTEKTDSYGLLTRTREDGDFGAQCIRIGGRLWSRDLIDSVMEITFLRDHLPSGSIDSLRIIDVGAGYGRLLHRLADTTQNANLFGADGVALSTAICRAYIRHQDQDSRVTVLSLAEVDNFKEDFDLATNVHSFSEMPIEIVVRWLDWLVERNVRYLFIVPNKPGPALIDGTEFLPQLIERGFELVARREKFDDPLIGKLAYYQSELYLFARR